MKLEDPILKSLVILYVTAVFLVAGEGVGESRSHLKGTVSVEGGKKLRNLVVYLERVGSSMKFSAKNHQIRQKGRHFQPFLTVILVGDTLQYLNDEDKEIDHNIYSLSDIANFDLGLGSKGTVLEHTFARQGNLNFFCSVHKMMEGRVIILPTRFFSILEQPGSFILTDVPPGKWKINILVLHKRFKGLPKKINIKAKGDSDINLDLKVIRK